MDICCLPKLRSRIATSTFDGVWRVRDDLMRNLMVPNNIKHIVARFNPLYVSHKIDAPRFIMLR